MQVSSTKEYFDRLESGTQYILQKIGESKNLTPEQVLKQEYPQVAVVLGSGLGPFVNEIENRIDLLYTEIPGMINPSVSGHLGKLVIGTLGSLRVVCLAGRLHAYEGYYMYELTFTTRLLKKIGVEIFIATNASGGCGIGMEPGTIMMIEDHVNLFKRNPFCDLYESDPSINRQPDLTTIYSKRLGEIARKVAKSYDNFYVGVYCGHSGPTYETPLEIQWNQHYLHGSAVGMSTVPETCQAHALGMEVIGFCLCTNLAAGLADEKLTHDAVKKVSEEAGPRFVKFMKDFLSELTPPNEPPSFPILNPQAFVCPLPLKEQGRLHNTDGLIEAKKYIQLCARERGVDEHYQHQDKEIGGAILLGREWIDYISQLNDIEVRSKLPYYVLGSFPSFSHSGINGKMWVCVSKSTSKIYLFCFYTSYEGFRPEEESFLGDLFLELNVPVLVAALPVGSTKTFQTEQEEDKLEVGELCLLEDYLHWISLHFLPQRIISNGSFEHTTFNSRFFPLTQLSKLPTHIQSSTEKLNSGRLISFLGPSSPTHSELNFSSQKLKANCSTVFPLSILSSGLAFGQKVYGFGVVTHESHNPPKDIHDDICQKVQYEKFIQLFYKLLTESDNDNQHKKIVSLFANNVKHSSQFKSRQQVVHELSQPVKQGNFDDILKQAQEFSNKLTENHLKDFSHTLLFTSDSLFNSVKSTLGNEVLDSPTTVDGLCPGILNQNRILVSKNNDLRILSILSSTSMNEGWSFSEITFPIYFTKQLGKSSSIIIGEVCSVVDDIKVGDIVSIESHLNFSGRHPLFGHNDPRWGERFPDAGHLYSKQLQQAVHNASEASGVKIHEKTRMAGFGGPILNSTMLLRLIGVPSNGQLPHYACQVASTTMFPEVLTACHIGVDVCIIGVVTSSIAQETPLSSRMLKNNDSVSGNLSKLLTSLIVELSN